MRCRHASPDYVRLTVADCVPLTVCQLLPNRLFCGVKIICVYGLTAPFAEPEHKHRLHRLASCLLLVLAASLHSAAYASSCSAGPSRADGWAGGRVGAAGGRDDFKRDCDYVLISGNLDIWDSKKSISEYMIQNITSPGWKSIWRLMSHAAHAQ